VRLYEKMQACIVNGPPKKKEEQVSPWFLTTRRFPDPRATTQTDDPEREAREYCLEFHKYGSPEWEECLLKQLGVIR